MAQANVFTAVSNAIWYTDKVEIVTGATAVTYNIYVNAIGNVVAAGNMYSVAPQVNPNGRQQIYVGAGNQLTITGANFTAREIGTASSAQSGVNGQG